MIEQGEEKYIILVLEKDFDFLLHIDAVILCLVGGAFLAIFLLFRLFNWRGRLFMSRFEIEKAQFGLHNQKITLRPNNTDRQIAYQIWVELSTRKIGLEIDLENDVVIEIYDSWYSFFSVVRHLIKDIPATKFLRKDTEQIIYLSIELLNEGLRPHLTRWQSKFRRWYDQKINSSEMAETSPQEIQKNFPQYEELFKDLMQVNKNLINYRKKMYELVTYP